MVDQSWRKRAELAQAAYRRNEFQAAAHAFSEAAQLCQAAGDPLMAAELANNCSVSWLQAGNPEQALAAASGTDLVFAQSGDLKRQGIALGNQAAALDALHRYEEAMPLYLQSAELLEKAGEGELRAYVMQAISKVQFRTGRQFEALASMQAGIEGIKQPSLRQKILKRLLRIPMRWLGSR